MDQAHGVDPKNLMDQVHEADPKDLTDLKDLLTPVCRSL